MAAKKTGLVSIVLLLAMAIVLISTAERATMIEFGGGIAIAQMVEDGDLDNDIAGGDNSEIIGFVALDPAPSKVADDKQSKLPGDLSALYLLLAAAAVNILTNLLKTRLLLRVIKKLDPRYRSFVPLTMGVIIAALVYIQTGDINSAVAFVMAGPAAVGLHELIGESILGGSKSRCRNKG